MIINKSSHERGFAYGSIYKSEIADLTKMKRRGDKISHHFGLTEQGYEKYGHILDFDGLPYDPFTI